MSSSLFSASWYRVAGVKPRLRSHVRIGRHHYRGELWYVLEDRISGKVQRFTPSAYQVIGLMDGSRTVQQIWDAAKDRLKQDSVTQEEMVRLLSQLNAADALQADVMPDPSEILQRFEKKKRQGRWMQNLRSPLFMRFSLFDPERFLTRFQHWAQFFFGWQSAVIWLAVVGMGMLLAGLHWRELTHGIADRVLAPSNLVILWLTYPILKGLHELGHAFAVKTRGGEVHEIGIMLLVLTPVPYVDASSAAAFPDKRDRVLVGAAGMAVEVFIAAVALMLWVNVEPGFLRSLLYNVIFIASVSSLVFNGNPLLRYDAYYILSDLIEIPNLATRGMKYLGYLVQRHLLGAQDAKPPPSTTGERVWFVAYSVLSWCYRLTVFVAIVLFIASRFFFVGVVLAVWSALNMFVWPFAKSVNFIAASPLLRRSRTRAAVVCGLFAAAAAALVLLLPFPLRTMTEGVVWVPEHAFVRAETDGFVEAVPASPGARVDPHQPLIASFDPLLPAEIRVLESKLRELEATYDAQVVTDKVQAEITRDKISHFHAKLADALERQGQLTIRSKHRGTFLAPNAQDLPGRLVKRGELLGYVLDPAIVTARVVVAQSDVDLVRSRTIGVDVRFPESMDKTMPAQLIREVPAATDRLPGRALTQDGGGAIAVDPTAVDGVKAFQKLFLFDIDLPPDKAFYCIGGRVYVRFDHGTEPLGFRWYRQVRQLFLKRFNV